MIYLIVNPLSGNGKAKKYIPRLKKYLEEREINYQILFTEYKGHATLIAQTLQQSVESNLVIAVGGDGTLNEVINGTYPSNIPIGYIPSGSGNDFARESGISLDPILSLEKILKKNEKTIDIGKVNGRYFINAAGIGFDGKVTELANRSKFKKSMGKFVYILAVLQALFTFRPTAMTIKVNGKTHSYEKVWLVAVSNGRYFGGGMKISPEAKNDDGELDICVIKDLSVLQLLKFFPTIFSGKHIYLPYVEMLKGKTVNISSNDNLPIQVDGEIPEGMENLPLEFQIMEQSLQIV